jgi:hypothetical protein
MSATIEKSITFEILRLAASLSGAKGLAGHRWSSPGGGNRQPVGVGARSATGGKAAEESSFKKLGPRQWGAKAGVQKLGPDVVN